MKFALVWNAPNRLVDISTRFEPYVEGLKAHGIDALTVCPAGAESGYAYPVHPFTDEHALADPDFWRALGCSAVAVITWHRMTRILSAARAAGQRVLAIGESDGQVSPRLHPWETFRFMTYLQPTIRGKLGAAKHWVERFLLRSDDEHRELTANTAAADVYTLGGTGPVAAFRDLLTRVGSGHLVERVQWLPYPIPEAFCTAPVLTDRPPHVVAVGRWDSPQKNARLLAGTAARLGAAGATRVTIVGPGAESRFGALARRYRTVQVLGVTPRHQVLDLMAGCRAVLIPSRWEGCPIVASEMLALGGTVVGTPIVSVTGLVDGGRFGRVARAHRSADLAAAVDAEMAAWDRGDRHPDRISAHWRAIVGPDAVAGRMLTLLGTTGTARREGVRA